jgi:hypothetical protein
MATRWARFARGWLAAGFATFVAALFHVASGGDAPGTAGVALALAFSGIACVALAGRRLSLWRLAVSVALSQFLFHALFQLGQNGGPAAGSAAPLGSAHAQMSHVDIATLVGSGTAQNHSMLATHSMWADTWMWAGHAVAALVTIVALRYGEVAFWSLYRTARLGLARLLSAPAPLPLDTARPAPSASRGGRVVRDLGILIGRMRHRGPPMFCSFA